MYIYIYFHFSFSFLCFVFTSYLNKSEGQNCHYLINNLLNWHVNLNEIIVLNNLKNICKVNVSIYQCIKWLSK